MMWSAVIPLWVFAVAADVAAIWRLVRGWRRRPAPGLNTVADAITFVAVLRGTAEEAPSPLLHHRPHELASRLRAFPPTLDLHPEPVPAHVEGFPIGLRVTRTELVPTHVMATPIYDALVVERDRRRAALRMPTSELRIVFDALVDRWLCAHCDEGDCEPCPGCSCPCKLPVLVGVA